jgi:hypothetical protein
MRASSIVGLGLSALFLASAAGQVPFTSGDLVVLRLGDGSAALTNAATAGFLVEVSPAGTVVQTIALPTAVSGSNRAFANSGTATSEGSLSLSADGNYLTLTGYDAAPGTPSVAASTSATVNRVVARVNSAGTIDTTTALSDSSFSGSNPRSAVTSNGTDIWIAGTASSAANGGVRYTTLGGSASTQLSSDVTNTRVARIFGQQLYVSSMSGAFRGVSAVGTGLPTTSAQSTVLLSGFDPSITSTQSVYAFYFSDSNTLYVADDRSATSGGGIQKWALSGGTWALQYTIALGTGTAGGARGLAGTVTPAGTVIYATTTEASNNRVVSVLDSGAASVPTDLASAGTNAAFRGVDFAPATVVAPSCYPNCDHSTTAPCLNVLDFSCFLNAFAAGDTYANCDNSTTPPVLNVLDFSCFLNQFAAGCSSC